LSHAAETVASTEQSSPKAGYFFVMNAKKITQISMSSAEIANAIFCHRLGAGRGDSLGASTTGTFDFDDLAIQRQRALTRTLPEAG
jgi:hypothetical protein